MKTAAIYCRVSTDNQEREGTSLETQLEACLKYCQDKGYDLRYRFSEAYSGLALERPKLNELRELVRNEQFDVLIVYCLDRLSRDPTHGVILTQELEKYHVTLEAVTETVDSSELGKLITYIRGFASKLEAEKIKERTVRGRKQRARNGRLPTGGQLYGCLYTKGKGEARGIRIPDTDRVPIVQNLFSWYVQEGLSLEKIQKRLYALGIASPEGKPNWSTSSILRLLSNRAYTGETVTHWKVGGMAETIEVPGATPTLIDRETFDAAQERMRLNKENAKRRGKREYLLRGMVFCACGRRMVGCAGKGKRNYRCGGHNWQPELHCERSIRADNLENAVWQEIKGILANPELVKAQIAKRHGNTQGAGELEAQIKTIDARLKALGQGEAAIARQLRQCLLSEDVAAKELRQGQQDRAALERERDTLRGQLEGVKQWADLDIDTLCKTALANLEAPTPEIQRLALQAFGSKVVVERQQIRVSVDLLVAPPNGSLVLQAS